MGLAFDDAQLMLLPQRVFMIKQFRMHFREKPMLVPLASAFHALLARWGGRVPVRRACCEECVA